MIKKFKWIRIKIEIKNINSFFLLKGEIEEKHKINKKIKK